MVYATDPGALAQALDLLPTRDGANVVFLLPYDDVVWEHTTTSQGFTVAAFSQVAADLLTGPGRMPEEGEALIEWLQEDGDRWTN
jgi:hypothetical protein